MVITGAAPPLATSTWLVVQVTVRLAIENDQPVPVALLTVRPSSPWDEAYLAALEPICSRGRAKSTDSFISPRRDPCGGA